ncbi:hypothetical protein L1887_27981 [Cichorium endivia]|nr:hypothetical protein L1887_27981 [Cichorium endivia]
MGLHAERHNKVEEHSRRTMYNMCTQKPPHDYSQQLYDRFRETCEEYITSTVLPSLREKHDEFMLKELVRRWSNHKIMVRWLSRFFHYLDRYFIARRSLTPLNEVGLVCFHDQVYPLLVGGFQWKQTLNHRVEVQYVTGKVGEAVISMIDREREGEKIDRAIGKAALEISAEIGMGKVNHYEDDFEPSMLYNTTTYYSRKASEWISQDSFHDYVVKVDECLKREKNMASDYLHSSCVPAVLEIVERELLSVDATKLLEKDDKYWLTLLTNDKVEDLSRVYKLCSKMPAVVDHASSMLKQHVTSEGRKLANQVEDVASNKQVFVRKVIELYDKYLSYVNDCFMNHTLFRKALDEACEIICNMGIAGSSIAELLATFCDNTLKKGGSEKLSDDAIEDTLEKVVKLLAYNNDKDRFAEFYRKKLAWRLLFDMSADDEHESSILIKLKRLCGGEFTSKMEGMVTDLTSAKEDQSHFQEYLSKNPNVSRGFDFRMTVLTGRFWPSYKSSGLNLPAEMVKCVEVFEDFYQQTTKQKKLTWIYSLGSCNINGKFEPKTMELIVTTYQASVLLLFNSSDRLSYQEIKTHLNLPDDDVVRLLHSLSCAKYKILLKEPNTKTISPTDYFEFNSKFTDKMRKIKRLILYFLLNMQIPITPDDEKKKVIEDVDQDRQYTIEASIVRIMKYRKVHGYQQLLLECVEQMKRIFKPDQEAIKKRIEDLITREFLERDNEDRNLLRYLP